MSKDMGCQPLPPEATASNTADPVSDVPASPRAAMSKRMLKALRGSIAKWEKIVAGTGSDMGADNCPLCKTYAPPPQIHCGACPVAAKTGRGECRGTPYSQFRRASSESERHEAAKAELAFLQSLLPAGEAS